MDFFCWIEAYHVGSTRWLIPTRWNHHLPGSTRTLDLIKKTNSLPYICKKSIE
jgi:hypothetical protein